MIDGQVEKDAWHERQAFNTSRTELWFNNFGWEYKGLPNIYGAGSHSLIRYTAGGRTLRYDWSQARVGDVWGSDAPSSELDKGLGKFLTMFKPDECAALRKAVNSRDR
jgi:hypothetical protein